MRVESNVEAKRDERERGVKSQESRVKKQTRAGRSVAFLIDSLLHVPVERTIHQSNQPSPSMRPKDDRRVAANCLSRMIG